MTDDFDARIRRLEDHAAICALITTYGPLADNGDAEGVAAIWTANGAYSVDGFGEARGRDEIAALIRSPTHRELMETGCAHVLTVPVITLDEHEAIARNYSVVFRNDGDRFTAWRVSANLWQLIRVESGWLVSRRENAPLIGNEAARALLLI